MKSKNRGPQRYRRINTAFEAELDPYLVFPRTPDHGAQTSVPKVQESHIESSVEGDKARHWLQFRVARSSQRFRKRSWTFGIHAGLYASTAVLLGNVALLVTGSIAHGGVIDGIGTIAQGDMRRISLTSTAYHLLINVLSTVLLTSSNYAMQILCAPTRSDIDRAHSNGHWLEVGIMSIRNLRHIDRRRAMLWALLAITSAPLHLL